jgi:hypothetical protein
MKSSICYNGRDALRGHSSLILLAEIAFAGAHMFSSNRRKILRPILNKLLPKRDR